MNINSINNSNSFKGFIIGTDRTHVKGKCYRTSIVGDDTIIGLMEKCDLFEKLNQKNTDVVIINNAGNTEKTVFLLNSTNYGDSYVPIDKQGEPYILSLGPQRNSEKTVLTKIQNFINKAEEYATSKIDIYDNYEDAFIDTELGKKLLKIMVGGDTETSFDSVVSSPEEVFSQKEVENFREPFSSMTIIVPKELKRRRY